MAENILTSMHRPPVGVALIVRKDLSVLLQKCEDGNESALPGYPSF